MKHLENLNLSSKDRIALSEAKRRLLGKFGVKSLILFGSLVRGEADEESDIDLLVLTGKPLDRISRHQITDIVCEVNLEYDSNLSTLVADEESWERGLMSFLPIKREIERDGVII